MNVAINKVEIQKELLHQQLIIVDMKTIGIIGLILSLIGLLASIYCQIEVLPNYNVLDIRSGLTEMERIIWRDYSDQKFLFGSVALFLGALSAIMGLISGIKNQKIGWIALGLGLVSFMLGAVQSTHMFS